jgi:uncharacterized protein
MKQVPRRTCIICRESRNKRELVRIVRRPDGTVKIDETGKESGRGAYICRQSRCWQQALTSKGAQRAVRLAAALKVKISDGDAAELMQYADALQNTAEETVTG